jgi:hypothetical protein
VNDQTISSEKLEKAYHEILAKYDYPTCLALPTDAAEISVLLGKDPESVNQFFRTKLQAIDSSLEPLWVPTTLFQLFVLHEYFHNPAFNHYVNQLGRFCGFCSEDNCSIAKDQQLHEKLPYTLVVNMDSLILESLNLTDPSTLFAVYSSINHRNDIAHSFLAINQAFIKWCKMEFGDNVSLCDLVKSNKAVEKLLCKIPLNLSEWKRHHYPYGINEKNQQDVETLIKLLENKETLITIFNAEVEAYALNQHLLFRGAEIVNFKMHEETLELLFLPWNAQVSLSKDFSIRSEDLESYSLSYGNSLFGGLFFSLEACAGKYVYLPCKKCAFHGICLEGENILGLSSLFAIPNLHPFAEMLSKGEWFHVHSKIAVQTPDTYCCDRCCPGFLNHSHFLDQPGFLLTQKIKPEPLGLDLISLAAGKGIIFYSKGIGKDQLISNHKNFTKFFSKG